MSRHGEEAGPGPCNEVTLRGRLTAEPVERELPSGDVITTFRVSVARQEKTPLTARSQQSSDWVDCVAGGARVRRSIAGWCVGDEVEVHGSLRRRFYRTQGAAVTRLEVQVVRVRRHQRAAVGPVT